MKTISESVTEYLTKFQFSNDIKLSKIHKLYTPGDDAPIMFATEIRASSIILRASAPASEKFQIM